MGANSGEPARVIGAADAIDLTENAASTVPRERLPMEVAAVVRDKWSHIVDIQPEFGGNSWRLVPRSYVGQIPVSKSHLLRLKPKVALSNVFYMLDIAYRAKFLLFDHVTTCETLEDSYDRLARILAKRVLDRTRKGLYRSYVPDEDRLSFVRGRVNIRESLLPRMDVRLHCHFEEHTADLEENQILLWTLGTILRGRGTQPETTRFVKAAHRAMCKGVGLVPFSGPDCVGRIYNRLNEDYRNLHCLCRFFLEQMTPTLRGGKSDMLPFLIEMSGLFELYVAESLRAKLPDGFRIAAQERVKVHDDGTSCHIDLVLYDAVNNQPIAVLDTKYKSAEKANDADIYQVVAYAGAKRCSVAVLVYPERVGWWSIAQFGDIKVYGLGWSIDGDMQVSIKEALKSLAELIDTPTVTIG